MIYSKSNAKPLGLKVEKFDIDPNTHVNIREIAATDILYYQGKYKDEDKGFNVFLYACDMLAHSIVDDEGNQIFDDEQDVAKNFKVGTSTLYAMQAKIYDLSKAPIRGDDSKN
jgi:hypothetical protein